MTAYAVRHPAPAVAGDSVVEVLITHRATTVDAVPIPTAAHPSPAAAAIAHLAGLAEVHGRPVRARLTHQAAGTTAAVVVDPDGQWRIDLDDSHDRSDTPLKVLFSR